MLKVQAHITGKTAPIWIKRKGFDLNAAPCPSHTKGKDGKQGKKFVGCKGKLFSKNGQPWVQICKTGGKAGPAFKVTGVKDAVKKIAVVCGIEKARANLKKVIK